MATTKYKIAEQVILMLTGSNPGVANNYDMGAIKTAIEQRINTMLKMEYFPMVGAFNENIPNGASVATYDNISVSSSGISSATAILPAMPVRLPRSIGVFQIINPETGIEYIPLEMGQRSLLQSQPLINDIMGQVGYEVYGKNIVFSKNIAQLGVPVVTIRLVVLDMSQYDDWDLLPIPADMESQVIEQVYKLFMTQPPADYLVDSTATEAKTPLNQQKQS